MCLKMAIVKIRDIPRDLPPARLYLDDVKEITDILVAAYAPRLALRNKVPEVFYYLGEGYRGDARATSIEDLKSIGGSSSNFRISVGKDFALEVGIRGALPPEASLHMLPEDEARAVYQKIESIFRHRVLTLKNVLSQIPSWLKFTAFLLVGSLWPLPITLSQALSRTSAEWKIVFFAPYFTAMLCAAMAVFFGVFQRSRVVFADSYEKSRLADEARKGWFKAIGLTLLGSFITLVFQAVFKALFH
jgi:hypothetical protein